MRNLFIMLTCVVLSAASSAKAVKIADVTHLYGQRTNVLTGFGLVFGLKGTGDGGDFNAAMRPLKGMLDAFANPVELQELSKANNVAIVMITATVPSTGAHQGDHIDARVMSVGSATSLKNGRLFVCPMIGSKPNSGVFALTEGAIDLEDPTSPNVGVIHGGTVMEVDMQVMSFEGGKFSLVIEAPSVNWTNAALIAKTINGAESLNGEEIARAIDANKVVVLIPPAELEHPDSFVSRVQQLPLIMLPTEARVKINRRKGALVVSGDVEISPVVISYNGLTIDTTTPAPVGRPGNPVVTVRNSIALDTTNQGGARLQDLVNALEQLRVSAQDRIAIVDELYGLGKLHAKLIEESN